MLGEPRRLPRTLLGPSQWCLSIALFQAVGWVSLLASSRDWLGSWKMAYDWACGSVLVVGPMAAGVSAVAYSRFKRASTFDLMRAAASSGAWLRPLLMIWFAAVISTGLLAIEVTVLLGLRGVPATVGQLINVPFVLALILAHVSMGAYLGLHLRDVWAGVFAVAASFFAFLLAAIGLLPPTFLSGSTTGSLVGQVYRPSALALLFLSATGLVVLFVASTRGQFVGGGRLVAGALIVVGAGVSSIGYAPRLDLEGRLQSSPVRYVCRGHDPSLCVARETPLLAGDGARALRTLASPLVAAGADLPAEWFQRLPGDRERNDAGRFEFTNNSESSGHLRRTDVVYALTMPADCNFDSTEPAGSIESRRLLGTWIAVRNDMAAEIDPDVRAWAQGRPSEAWVRATYNALRECRLDDLTPPT